MEHVHRECFQYPEPTACILCQHILLTPKPQEPPCDGNKMALLCTMVVLPIHFIEEGRCSLTLWRQWNPCLHGNEWGVSCISQGPCLWLEQITERGDGTTLLIQIGCYLGSLGEQSYLKISNVSYKHGEAFWGLAWIAFLHSDIYERSEKKVSIKHFHPFFCFCFKVCMQKIISLYQRL